MRRSSGETQPAGGASLPCAGPTPEKPLPLTLTARLLTLEERPAAAESYRGALPVWRRHSLTPVQTVDLIRGGGRLYGPC